MRHFIGRGLVVSGTVLLALSLAAAARAVTVSTDSNGIRHEIVTVGPIYVAETKSGQPGVGTYFYSYSYRNLRDSVDAILQTNDMGTPEPDVTNLVAHLKSSPTWAKDLQNLSNDIVGPYGVGDSTLPAGFHGQDRNTWATMGFFSDDWSARYQYAVTAMKGACDGITGAENTDHDTAVNCIQSEIGSGLLGSWDFGSIFDAVSWDYNANNGQAPEDIYLVNLIGWNEGHFVPTILQNPGADLEDVWHSYDDRTEVGGLGDGQTYVAVSFFLSQAQRWLKASSLLASWGAPALAAEAFNFCRDDAGILTSQGDPLVLDLDHDRIINVTGRSSAIRRAPQNMPFVSAGSVRFDLYETGPITMEWVKPGDGFLVDAARAKEAVADNRPFNGRDLMGDAEGQPGGFAKLARYDRHHAGKIAGKDLDQIAVWINKAGDGKYHPGELFSLAQLGITEIDYKPHFAYDKDHEPLEQASFVQHGKRYVVQEVWFAFKPQHLASKGGK